MSRGKNNANKMRGALLKSETKAASGGKTDICIPFLTGKCSFKNNCRKRHPSKEEIPRVLARYKKTRCKFKDECYTEGCLFLHPKEEENQKEPNFIASHHFPPLSDTCTSASPTSSESKGSADNDSAWNKSPPIPVSPSSEQGPAAAWGKPDLPSGEPPMMVSNPPPQQPLPGFVPPQHGYYQGPPPPGPPMMVPNMPPPVIDPNTGYPVDPSFYYYDQQQFYFHQQFQQQMVPPYPIIGGNGMVAPPMGIPFNAEAKEFIPEMPAEIPTGMPSA